MNPKDLDKVFMTRFPWITMSVVDKSIMSLRLRPRSLLSELASVSRQDLGESIEIFIRDNHDRE